MAIVTTRRRHPTISPASSASLSPAASKDSNEQQPNETTSSTVFWMAQQQRRRRRRKRPTTAATAAHHQRIYYGSILILASVALLGVTHHLLLLSTTTTTTIITETDPREHRHSGEVETANAKILTAEALRKLELAGATETDNSNSNNNVNNDPARSLLRHRGYKNTASTMIHSKHKHAIPNILIFTHRWNLLEQDPEAIPDVDDDERQELHALRDNVRNTTIPLHPGARVRFLTDADCRASLRRMPLSTTARRRNNNNETNHDDETTTTTTSLQERLVHHFDHEPQGMFKADLCRGAAVYETGGLYLDVDLGVRLNLFTVLNTTTEFATVKVHRQSQYRGAFFQAFVAAAPHHPVLRRYVELFLDHYEGRLRPRIAKGPLGVLLLKRAYDEIQAEQQQQIVQQQQQQAKPLLSAAKDKDAQGNDDNDPAQVTTATAITTTHLNATTEIWQEALYLPELRDTLLRDVPPPVWGTRRACKFVVLARRSLPLQVPFYSRIAGSRMCPRNNATATTTEDININDEQEHDAKDGSKDDSDDDENDEEEDEEVMNSNPHQDAAAESKER